MPLVAGPRTTATQLIHILLAKLVAPFPNRFIRHTHSALQQDFFHIAEAQAEAKYSHTAWLMISMGNR
jgi:hypothetical protein